MKEHSFSMVRFEFILLYFAIFQYSEHKRAAYGRVASTSASSQTIYNVFQLFSKLKQFLFKSKLYVLQLCVCNSNADFCEKVLLSVRKKERKTKKAMLLIWLIQSVSTNAMALCALYKVFRPARECVQNRLIIEKWNFWFLLTLLQNVIHTFRS